MLCGVLFQLYLAHQCLWLGAEVVKPGISQAICRRDRHWKRIKEFAWRCTTMASFLSQFQNIKSTSERLIVAIEDVNDLWPTVKYGFEARVPF